MKIGKQFNVGQTIGGMQGHQPTSDQRSRQSLVGVLREFHTALRGNLTFGDNIVGQFETIEVTTSATYSGGNFSTIVVPWNFANKKAPQSVVIGQVLVPSSQAKQTVAVQPQWTYDSVKQVINVHYLTGLNNSSKYAITLEAK